MVNPACVIPLRDSTRGWCTSQTTPQSRCMVIMQVGGVAVLLRVVAVHDKTEEEQEDMAVYHCHCGK